MNSKTKKKVFYLKDLIRIVLYILIYWSILALGTTKQIPISLLVMFSGLVTYSLWPSCLLRRLPDFLWTLFTIGAFLFTILYIKTDFLMALLLLFIYLIINKLSNPIQIRDEIQVIALCFFLCVCVMTISESLFLSPIILVYFILFSISLMLVTFQWDIEETQKGTLWDSPNKSSQKWETARIYSLMKYNLKFLLFIFPCSILLFLFIPRFSSYHILTNIQNIRSSPSTTGYSENVKLGSMIGLKKDRTIAMRVQPMNNKRVPKQLPDVYIRGGSLDFYDGRQWLKSIPSKRLMDIVQQNFVSFNRVSQKKKIWTPQRIHLETTVCPFIMGINQPYAFQFSKPYQFSVDYESNSIRLLNPDMTNISYTAFSYRSIELFPGKEDLNKQSATPENISRRFSRLYLQKPPEGWDPRIVDLAKQITGGAATNFEKAVKIRKYLIQNYSYSLEFMEKGEEEPIQEFLFDRKTGHCEFFATAMVILCRAVNIPSRIVNGFYSKEWNNYGNYFIIRKQDAHSWVEVWFSSTEWMSFDPTPPAGLMRIDSNPLIPSFIQDFYDSLKFRWQRHIIDYNLSDQIRLGSRFRKISGGLSGVLEKFTYQVRNLGRKRKHSAFTRFVKMLMTGLGISLVAISLVALCFKLLSKFGKTGRKKLGRHGYGRHIIIQEYEDILLYLKKMGFTRLPYVTPKEFACEVIGLEPRLSSFLAITIRYYELRYHHEECTQEDREKFRRFLSGLQDKKHQEFS